MQLKLRAKRVEKGMFQKDVAEYLGISVPAYCRKETGHGQFTFNEVVKLIKLFNCKFEDIFII